MDGTPKPEVGDDPDLDAIRKMIEIQPRRRVDAVAEPASVTPAAEDRSDTAPGRTTPAPHPKQDSFLATAALSLLERVKAFLGQPEAPRRLALAMLVLIIILRPLAVLGMALFVLMVGLITYFSLGPDRVAELILAWYQSKKERDPDGAEALRARAARLSRRLERMFARLPERWTQGLYLPDFEEPKPLPDRLANDPFDRLVPQSKL